MFRKPFNNLYDNNKVSKDELLEICPVDSTPVMLFGNPNFHKPVVDNMPKFRSNLPTIKTPGYNLAQFLTPILERLTHNQFIVKDSFSFAKEIAKYDSSLFMARLDAESLFTNIPLKEAMNN